ncbi:calcium release-activated calcium channel protein 1 isoform X1 [Drosophila nasuta]|uniref:calcium release-activated calcium channel protein 1 isoform X1 n=1 Tax=Drosophila nasuta TaxID=42062 RepID=UPI00295ED38F|nr:calcium release-activated calcium channel protein 1 isoform X1 [Drosophila nasuta]
MRSNCFEVPLKPPRRQKLSQSTDNQREKGELQGATKKEREQLLTQNLSGSKSSTNIMYSNLRYARTNLSHSSLLLNQQQSSFDGSEHPTSTTERTESSETLDTPLSTTTRELPNERERERERESEKEVLSQQALPLSLPLAAANRPLLPPAASRRYALASALHATAKLAASVDAYTAAATANAANNSASAAGHCHGDYSLCDSYRPSRLSQYQQQQQQLQQQQQQLGFSRYTHSVPSSIVGSTRYLNYSNLHSNSPHASSRRFNAQQQASPPPPLSSSSASASASATSPPLFPLPGSGTGTGLGPAAAAAAAAVAPPPPIPRRTARSSMSQSGEDLHSPTYLSWRKLQLSRAKLKASSKTSALLSGFAMVAMVEVQLDKETLVPPSMLVAFAICTTLLVAVHMLALMISTCILPNIETVCNLHSISLVHESPHERLHWYIETAWAFSTLLGLILFLVEIAILCWVKFYDLSKEAAWSAVVVLIPVMVVFLAFAVHFYRSLVTHKYEVTVSGIRELEMLKEQMEQDHLEIHNNARNNGFNYGASGDIV